MCLRASPLVLQQSFIKLHTDVIHLLERTALRFKPGLHVYTGILLLIFQPFLFPLIISKWIFSFPYFKRMNVIFFGMEIWVLKLYHDYRAKHISASYSKSVGEFYMVTSFFWFLPFISYCFSPSKYDTVTALILLFDMCKLLLLTTITYQNRKLNWAEMSRL